MSRLMKICLMLVLALTTVVLVAPEADARRLGGGRSFGKSFGSAKRTAPTRSSAAAGKTSRRGGMMGPLAGLAAGLGIAALASALGFGEGLANLITIALVVGGGIFLLRFLARRFGGGQAGRGLAGAVAGRAPGNVSNLPGSNAGVQANAFSGNPQADQATQAAPSVHSEREVHTGVPADFDVDGFLREAKVQFIRLQAVYDAGDLKDLREFTSPEVFGQLQMDITERGQQGNQTDVVTLEAELLGLTQTDNDYIAGVQFSGMVRESEEAGAESFKEVWTLTKGFQSGGWTLAGIEQSK